MVSDFILQISHNSKHKKLLIDIIAERTAAYYKQKEQEFNLWYENYQKEKEQKIKERNRKVKLYNTKNKEKIKQYRRKNKHKINERIKKRRKIDIKYRLNQNIRSAISRSLKGNKNGHHWETLVGYKLKDLKKHLENQFTAKNGYAWSNYGAGKDKWNIDHIVPIAAFNFNKADDPDFKKCWALSNLQPLWHLDNIRKGAKIDKSFHNVLSKNIES